MTTETAIPEEIRDVTKGTIEGLNGFIEKEVLPLEQEFKEVLGDERKLFGDDGLLVGPVREARDSVRRKSAQAGFWSMFAPAQIGGGGLPASIVPFVLESLYRRYGPGRLFITWSHGFLTSPIVASFVDGPSGALMLGTEAVKKEIVPQLVAGEKTLCFGLSEPDAGSDLYNLKCRARRDGDEWVINGTKQWITNAPYADYAMIFAVSNPEMLAQKKGGITCLLVDAKSTGYRAEKALQIMGHVSSDCGSITLDDVRVRADYMLGVEDQGFQVGMFGISEGRLGIAAGCVGMAEWALDRALDYSKQRKTFGVPIAEHQAIQFMLADSAMEIFAAKQVVVRTSQLVEASLSGGRLPVKEISIAKAYAVEMAQRVLDRAIQIHGGMGLSGELALEEGFRIARTLRIPDGTSEIQRRTIARQLLRGDTVF